MSRHALPPSTIACILAPLLASTNIACPGLAHAPPKLSPTPTSAQTRPLPDRPEALEALGENCLDPGWDDADLLLALDRAFDTRDPRCWIAREIALADWLLAEAERSDKEDRARTLRENAELHARQAELRARRHAFDDLAALARLTLARSAMSSGDAQATLTHLKQAAAHVSVWAASGHAPRALDAIDLELFVEALAQWEREGDRRNFDLAAAAATRLHGREVLREFLAAGIDPVRLAEAAENDEAHERLEELSRLEKASQEAWGTKVRDLAPKRAELLEALTRAGAGWMAAAPLLLDFLPGTIEGLDDAVAAVLAAPEVVLAYVTGPAHGGVLVITETGQEAFTLPGAAALEAMIARCLARDPHPRPLSLEGRGEDDHEEALSPSGRGLAEGACAALDEALLQPAAGALASARQVLIIAHGPVHDAPFERLLGGLKVYRVPSLLSLAGLRLRAWSGRPAPHPAARDLLTRLPEHARAGLRGGGGARLLLAAGATEIREDRDPHPLSLEGRGGAATPGKAEGALRFGVPLTVPVPEVETPEARDAPVD